MSTRSTTSSSSAPARRAGRGGVRGVGGAEDAGGGAAGGRRPGRDELTDSQLPRVPRGDQRGEARLPDVPAGVDVRGAVPVPAGGLGSAASRTTSGWSSSRRVQGPQPHGGGRHRRHLPHARHPRHSRNWSVAACTTAPRCRRRRRRPGHDVVVVGGGNSAGQAAMHLSKYADHVTVMVRGETLAVSMSEYLIRELDAAPNVSVRYNAEIVGGGRRR